jgi:hypothetical protein
LISSANAIANSSSSICLPVAGLMMSEAIIELVKAPKRDA